VAAVALWEWRHRIRRDGEGRRHTRKVEPTVSDEPQYPPPPSGPPAAPPPPPRPAASPQGGWSSPPPPAAGGQPGWGPPPAGGPQGWTPAPQAQAAGLDPKIAGLLSYLFGWIGGLIIYLTQKDREVRFHAAQSIILSVGLTLFWIVWQFVTSIFVRGLGTLALFGLISLVIGLGTFGLWIYMCIQGYSLNHTKLPFAGDLAEQWAVK